MEKWNWRVDKLHYFLLQFWQACKVSNQIFCHSGNKLIKNNSTKRFFNRKEDQFRILTECCVNWSVCCPANMIIHDNHGPSPKIDFVKERILLLLFSQHQGLNRSIRLPRCNALWPQNEQSWDAIFTPKCPYIPIHNQSSQESAGTHPKHVFSKLGTHAM